MEVGFHHHWLLRDLGNASHLKHWVVNTLLYFHEFRLCASKIISKIDCIYVFETKVSFLNCICLSIY